MSLVAGHGDAPCHVSVILRRQITTNTISDPLEAVYLTGLEALADDDKHRALGLLQSVLDQDEASVYESARLLVCLLSLELGDARIHRAAQMSELSDRGADDLASRWIAASVLSVAPEARPPKLALSSFLEHPRIALKLGVLGSILVRGDWLAAVDALEVIADLLALAQFDINPPLAFLGTVNAAGDPLVGDLAELVRLLIVLC